LIAMELTQNLFLKYILHDLSFKLFFNRVKNGSKNKSWITIGKTKKTSYQRTRRLYLASRNTNVLRLESHYKVYCKILSIVIKKAKQNYYNNQILESNNKIKNLLEIVKLDSGRKNISEEAQVSKIDGKYSDNPQSITDTFNEYFLSLVE